jgi:peptide chain release factor 2
MAEGLACSNRTKNARLSWRVAWNPSGGTFDVPGLEARLSELESLVSVPDLWDDNDRAQALLKEQNDTRVKLQRIVQPGTWLEDVAVLIELGEAESDDSVGSEISGTLDRVATFLDQMEVARMLSGEHDGADALITINAGAGGTESQDWAEMLFRMYVRYCERAGWSVEILDRQDADEAGIKSASISVRGEYAYGMLRAEAGVHRLVRISPFDASARRHTSFAACFVYPDIEDDIEVEVNDADLRIDTYRSSGAGGQHVNKTSSAIRITHLPSGIVVQCQSQRSQHKNKASAMKVLRARLYDREQDARDEERSVLEDSKQEIAFGSQIRSYVLHPYRMVKDLRTGEETSNVDAVLDGDLEAFAKAYLLHDAS